MAKLPEIIFFDEPALPGAGFLLSTVAPFVVGKVLKFKDEQDMNKLISRLSIHDFRQVPGYYLIVQYFDNLQDMKAIRRQNIEPALQVMAVYYLQNKILKNEGYYKRYKEASK